MVYKFVEGITCADIYVEVEAKTLEEIFTDSGKAIIGVMGNPETVESDEKVYLTIQNNDNEKLLFEFLEEIISKKDEMHMVFNNIENISINNGKLECALTGEKININKHELRQDVKAITYHHFKLVKNKENWKATFVVDV